MKIIIKKLQGGECGLDVSPSTTVAEIKQQIAQQLNIPVDQQKLLLLGRTLTDEQTVQSYPLLKDGTKLNLIVKKPEGLLEVATKHFKKGGLSDKEAAATAKRLLIIVKDKFDRMSWDDINRLCSDCLKHEQGYPQTSTDNNIDHDGYRL